MATSEPPELRFLVRMAIHLPDGPLYANAFVSRLATAEDGVPGVGLQFFALAARAKERWDRFIARLGGDLLRTGPLPTSPPNPSFFTRTVSRPPTPTSKPSKAAARESEEPASFLVKLPSTERLAAFFQRAAEMQSLYMVTPLVRPVGSAVQVVLIHPHVVDEFVLAGKVTRVRIQPPKGIEIRLQPISETQQRDFQSFLAQSLHPGNGTLSAPSAAEEPWSGPLLDPDVEMPLRGSSDLAPPPPGRPSTEPPIPSPRTLSRRGANDSADLPGAPLPERTTDLPPAKRSGSISVDLTGFPPLSEESVKAHQRFDWGSVSDDLIIDLEIAESDDEEEFVDNPHRQAILEEIDEEITEEELLDAVKPSAAAAASTGTPSWAEAKLAALLDRSRIDGPTEDAPAPQREAESEIGEATTDPVAASEAIEPTAPSPARAPQSEAELRCTRCDYRALVRFGPPEDAIGHLASHRIYWCGRCARYASVLRLANAKTRAASIPDLRALGLPPAEALELAIRVADLSQPPRCPTCSGTLRTNRAVKLIERALSDLNAPARLEQVTCPECDHALEVVPHGPSSTSASPAPEPAPTNKSGKP